MYNYPMLSYYGGFRTRTFADIFPDLQTFQEVYETCGIPAVLKSGGEYEEYSLATVYALLAAEYMCSHIAPSSEDRFKLKFMSILYTYGPTWQRDMMLQKKLLDMSEEDILKGGKAIYNKALNPDVAPGTSALEELEYISEQNTTNYLKNRPDAYNEIRSGLAPSVTRAFVERFRELFIKVGYPDYPLLYVEEE